MNSRNLKKDANERVRDMVQAELTVDSDSDEEIIIGRARETRQGHVQIKSKKVEGAKDVEELKGLGLYEEGMDIEQVRAILQVIAESKETAATEENLRSKLDEWEDASALESTVCETEPKTPDTIGSVSSPQGVPSGELSQDLFTDEGSARKPPTPQALLDDTLPFCPSDEETMVCSPTTETKSPIVEMQVDDDSSSSVVSRPASPITLAGAKNLALPLARKGSVQHTPTPSDSELQGNQKTAKTVQEKNKRCSLSLRSMRPAESTASNNMVAQQSSDSDGSELKEDELGQVWKAKTLQKIAKKQSNRPKHKVPYYKLKEEKSKNTKEYTDIIVQSFNDYFKLVASLQMTLKKQENWGTPVQAGSHQKDTLDVKTARGKIFNFKHYMDVCKGENSPSNSETESDCDVFKKGTSTTVDSGDAKKSALSPGIYQFEDEDSESVAFDRPATRRNPRPKSSTLCNKDGGWIMASAYKRKLKVNVKAKTDEKCNDSDQSLPLNVPLANNPSIKESTAKRRKLSVKPPRGYDDDNSDARSEVIIVPDDKSGLDSSESECKGYVTRQRRQKALLHSCKSDKQNLKDARCPNVEETSQDESNDGEELVACPLCECLYYQNQIKYHASKCKGNEIKNPSANVKNSSHCFICKAWLPLVHYQAHVAKCMAMRSSSPLSVNEVTLLVGDKTEAATEKPTGSRLLDRLTQHDENSETFDVIETFRATKCDEQNSFGLS